MDEAARERSLSYIRQALIRSPHAIDRAEHQIDLHWAVLSRSIRVGRQRIEELVGITCPSGVTQSGMKVTDFRLTGQDVLPKVWISRNLRLAVRIPLNSS